MLVSSLVALYVPEMPSNDEAVTDWPLVVALMPSWPNTDAAPPVAVIVVLFCPPPISP